MSITWNKIKGAEIMTPLELNAITLSSELHSHMEPAAASTSDSLKADALPGHTSGGMSIAGKSNLSSLEAALGNSANNRHITL